MNVQGHEPVSDTFRVIQWGKNIINEYYVDLYLSLYFRVFLENMGLLIVSSHLQETNATILGQLSGKSLMLKNT